MKQKKPCVGGPVHSPVGHHDAGKEQNTKNKTQEAKTKTTRNKTKQTNKKHKTDHSGIVRCRFGQHS
jgi:hypothetical protein